MWGYQHGHRIKVQVAQNQRGKFDAAFLKDDGTSWELPAPFFLSELRARVSKEDMILHVTADSEIIGSYGNSDTISYVTPDKATCITVDPFYGKRVEKVCLIYYVDLLVHDYLALCF